MAELSEIIDYTVKPRKGVLPSFKPHHVLKTLIMLYNKGPLGRKTLSRELKIGEASTRTLISRLKEKKLVDVSLAGGAYLTEHGLSIMRNIMKKLIYLKPINTEELSFLKLAQYAYMALIRGGCKVKPRVIELRDKLVRYGAEAALIMCVEEGKLVLEPSKVGRMPENISSELEVIKKNLANIQNNDLVIISYSNTPELCEQSLLMFIIDFLG